MQKPGDGWRNPCYIILIVIVFIYGCVVVEPSGKKDSPYGLIITPPSYYSTPKARYLGQKYKENLDRLVERVVRNPATSSLQFANNVASVGGIGFFTHSAAKTPDERYLEVVLGVPDVLDSETDFNAKVEGLFSQYGTELLSILAADAEIFNEREMTGYGLNFSWRNSSSTPSGPRISMQRSIVYIAKNRVKAFLNKEVSQSRLLSEAIVFAVEEEGPTRLVSYRAQELKPDFRPPIQEETVGGARVARGSASVSTAPEGRAPVEKAHAREAIPEENVKDQVAPKTTGPTKETAATPRKPETSPSPLPTVPARRSEEKARKETTDHELLSEKTPVSEARDKPLVKEKTPPPRLNPGDDKSKGARAPEAMAKASMKPPVLETKPTPLPTPKAELEAPVAISPPADSRESESKDRAADDKAKEEKTLEVTAPVPVGQPQPKKVSEPKTDAPELETRPSETSPAPAAVVERPRNQNTEQPAARTLLTENKPEFKPLPPPSDVRPAEASQVSKPVAKLVEPKKTPEGEKKPEPESKDQIALRERTVSPKVPITPAAPPEPWVATPSAGSTVMPSTRPAAPLAAAPNLSKPGEPEENQQLALKRRLLEAPPQAKPVPRRPSPQALKGYIIQVSFSDRAEAQHWAETLERRGYAISLSATGGGESVRLRFGNFQSSDEAEGEIKKLRGEGLRGIVLNLPEIYTPKVPTSPTATPEKGDSKTGETVSSISSTASLARRLSRPVGPYVVQLSFKDRRDAQNWAQRLGREGHAVSLTAADGSAEIRLRVGDFSSRSQADNLLGNLRVQGLIGSVLQIDR